MALYVKGDAVLDLQARGSNDIAVFGTLNSPARVRIYDNNKPNEGYFLQKSSNTFSIINQNVNGTTSVGIGTTIVNALSNLQVQGTILTQNIGTYNSNATLTFNNQNIGSVNNIYVTGDIIKDDKPFVPPTITQLASIRSTQITPVATNEFVITHASEVNIDVNAMHVFYNGRKLAYVTSNVWGYRFTSSYDGTNTIFNIETAATTRVGDVIDVIIWPENSPLNYIRNSVYVMAPSSTFTVLTPGLADAYITDVEFFVNGYKMSYVDINNNDYTMQTTYDGTNTVFTFTTAVPVQEDSVVDITVWVKTARKNTIHSCRYATPSQNVYTFEAAGIVASIPQNMELFINGIKYAYVDTNNNDYTSYYIYNGINTVFTVILSNRISLNLGDTLDVTVWLGSGTSGSGLYSQWSGTYPIFYLGNVGIGTTNPQNTLSVEGSTYLSGYVGINNDNPQNALDVTGAVSVIGAIYATDHIVSAVSDARLKTKIGKIDNAVDRVCKLEGFTYTYNETANSLGLKDTRVQVGLTAQDVQHVLPEAVLPAPYPDYLTVQYERIVPLLVEAIKEQQMRIEQLERLVMRF